MSDNLPRCPYCGTPLEVRPGDPLSSSGERGAGSVERGSEIWLPAPSSLLPAAFDEEHTLTFIRSAKRLLENAWPNPSRAERAILSNLDTVLKKLDEEKA